MPKFSLTSKHSGGDRSPLTCLVRISMVPAKVACPVSKLGSSLGAPQQDQPFDIPQKLSRHQKLIWPLQLLRILWTKGPFHLRSTNMFPTGATSNPPSKFAGQSPPSISFEGSVYVLFKHHTQRTCRFDGPQIRHPKGETYGCASLRVPVLVWLQRESQHESAHSADPPILKPT